jgi:hypothetical protein
MTLKVSRYRKLAESLARLGDEHAKAITTDRYKLMYHYFVRCAGLTSAVVPHICPSLADVGLSSLRRITRKNPQSTELRVPRAGVVGARRENLSHTPAQPMPVAWA